MAFLNCCCWQSVRRGSFLSAVYSGIYFALVTATASNILQAESLYLSGNRSSPVSTSILEPNNVTPTTIRFSVTMLICSCCGAISTLLLLYGLCTDQRYFLLPWTASMAMSILVDMAHALFLLISSSSSYINPIMAMIHVFNFFILCMNVYSLLCVASQYQEYLAGRGTAADECNYRVPTVRYAVQPTTTATSCLSSRRLATNNETKVTVTPTPTESPTAGLNALPSDKSPTGRPLRKHVQFPDSPMTNQTLHPDISVVTCVMPKWSSEVEVAKLTTSPDFNDGVTTIMINHKLQSDKENENQHT
ncbi:uncharacterized protein [Prorops nasuta]|uniref:uncharacterized protein isoform X2 n=1 Tax=Prorops nasuta TaxID=863751 RepID=UPI0034CF80C4